MLYVRVIKLPLPFLAVDLLWEPVFADLAVLSCRALLSSLPAPLDELTNELFQDRISIGVLMYSHSSKTHFLDGLLFST